MSFYAQKLSLMRVSGMSFSSNSPRPRAVDFFSFWMRLCCLGV